jgi:hypothetical protein
VWGTVSRIIGHGLIVLVLTLLTQLGGLAWLLVLPFRRRWLSFPLVYGLIWLAVQSAAPLAGRVALPCNGELLHMQSPLYCVLLRNFVTPDMADLAQDVASVVEAGYPGTVTLILDGSFPFFDGFPLLPHLSHDAGSSLDFAYYYAAPDGGYLVGKTRSPIGYWAFERVGQEQCPPVWLTLRWDMGWLAPLFPDRRVEPLRTALLVQTLLDDPRTGKVFLEPGLAASLGVAGPKLRFQGCRAARHDDHVHVQF